MKILKLILALTIFSASSAIAQSDNGFEDFLRGGTDDANTLFQNYMTPFMKGMGYGFNNGWYNTAKPHQSLGFDLTFSLNAAIVPVADQSFVFDPADYNNTRLTAGSAANLPTLMGGNTDSRLENYIDNQEIDPNAPPGETVVGEYPAPNGIADDISAFTFGQIAVPSPVVQVGVGLFAGTELKVRWLPTINNDDFNFKYFGIGGMHSISQWIPGLKDLPIDISAFVGYTKIDAQYNIPSGNIAGEGQKAQFTVNTFTYQALASVKLSVLTVYAGLGMDNFNTNFRMLGTYELYTGQPYELNFADPIDIKEKGNGSFRTTLGARLKLAILTIHADYTFREYNTLTAGLGFSIR
jgi:hypothetical protein